MRQILLIAVLSLSLLGTPAAAQPGGAAATRTGAVPVVQPAPDRALMQAINDAWATLDPANAAPYYDVSPGNVFYDVAPLRYVGWDAYAGGAREYLQTLASMKYTVGEDAAVHVDGYMAWGTATLHLVTVDRQGHRTEKDLRWTPVWRRIEGRWLLVHEHVSEAAQPGP